MKHLTEQLILYRDEDGGSLLARMADLMAAIQAENDPDGGSILSDLFGSGQEAARRSGIACQAAGLTGELLKLADEYGYSGDLWQTYVAHYIACHENPFSLAAEKNQTCMDQPAAQLDCAVLRQIFHWPVAQAEAGGFRGLGLLNGGNAGRVPTDSGQKVADLRDRLAAAGTDADFYQTVKQFYQTEGVGALGLSPAFTVTVKGGGPVLTPVRNLDKVVLDDLIGYEVQKKKLVDNTEAFLKRKPANNVLLYGDGGTGKSTSVRAILNQYHRDGLRIIQVYRHQMEHLGAIIDRIQNRSYRFILYMDDLSFEDFETEYKFLKAVIEGGLQPRPENVLIYATSNRRHLIKETWGDRADMSHNAELHRSDSVEEKLSLAERFGQQIFYGKPSREEFHQMVEAIALREGLKTDLEEIHKLATQWEIRRGGVSGRSARQFIDYIKGMEE